MFRSAITTSLVAEARGGPFVYWDGLAASFASAAELGFDAVEIFAPGPASVELSAVLHLMERHGLQIAAVGTGAGMVKHGLSLTDPSLERRRAARDFVRSMIELGGAFSAPAIVGSMQGRWGGAVSREQAFEWLADALNELGECSARLGLPLVYEPLNRYETNLIKTLAEGVDFLKSLKTDNVRLLADLFHMNIEEANVATSIREAGRWIGHVHLADSNRQAAGLGHTEFGPIAAALREIGYAGYLSAEVFPIPSSAVAAQTTIDTFRRYFA